MKKIEIKNLKKLQLWSMVKFIQCVDEYYNEIASIDSDDSIFMNEFERYTFKRLGADIVAVYSNERPSPNYSLVKIQALLRNNKDNKKLDFSNVSFQITHSQQNEPIISCISGEELFSEINDLARGIENESCVEGLRTVPSSEYKIIDKEKELEELVATVSNNVDSFTSGAKSHPLFNSRLWGEFFSDNENLKKRYKEYLIGTVDYYRKFYKDGIDSDNFDDGCEFIGELIKTIGDDEDYVKWCSENDYEIHELYKCFVIIYKNILFDIFEFEE